MAEPGNISLSEIRQAIPERLFKKDELRFLTSVGYSLSFTLILAYLGQKFIPLSWWFFPAWVIYAIVVGTVWTGVWVLGHECGHGSFSNHKILNDILGYILHTTFLVPYFSWQHSHALHHAKTNHLTEGETHVPTTADSKKGKFYLKLKESIGSESFAAIQLFNITVIGWPIYLLFGVTGGPARGFTSHFFVPNQLFPQKTLFKVHLSNLGLLAMVYILYLWAQATSFAEIMAVYFGPYMIGNAWLTVITFLQHTDADVPHLDDNAFTWLKGALCTIDRNYPPFIDALHHHIGTTHVLHHIFSDLPHYNAKEAHMYMKQVIGDLHFYDSKNVLYSLVQAGKLITVEHKGNGIWKFN